MADRKISQLSSLTGVDSSDVIVVNDTSEGGSTKKATLSDVLTGLNIATNLRDSGANVVVTGDLDIQNEIVAGGDIRLRTGTLFFGGLQDETNSIFVSSIVDSDLGSRASDSALATSGAIKDYVDGVVGLSGRILVDSVGTDAAAVYYPVMVGTSSGRDSAVVEPSMSYNSTTGMFTMAGALTVNGALTVDSVTVTGNLVPSADSAYDLGTSSLKWKDLYLSGSTINLGGRQIKEVGNNLVIVADAIEATQFIGDGSQLSGVNTSEGVADSAKARALFLDPLNGQVITYDSTGTESPAGTLQFQAIPENNASTPQYSFFLDGVLQSTGVSGDTFTLQQADEPAAGESKVVKATATENIGAGGNLVYNDTLTIYGIKDGGTGVDAVTAFLTNESHTEPADSAGNLTTSLTDAGGTYKVFVGTTDITGDASLTYSKQNESGLTSSIGTNGVYSITGVSADKGTVDYRVVVPASLVPRSNNSVTVDKTYTVSKSRQGIQGIQGPEGAGGEGGRAVKVVANEGFVIRYDSAGNEFDTLTFTAIPENTANTVTYDWFVKDAGAGSYGAAVQSGPLTNFTLPDGSEPGVAGVKLIKCEMYENTNGADSAEKGQDVVNVYGLVNGFTITGFLTNSSHVEPADSTGELTTTLADAGGRFNVFLGTTLISGDAGVTFSNISNNGINVAIQDSGTYTLSSFINANTNNGTAEFKAVVANSLIPGADADFEIVQKYSVAKSRQGVKGTGVGSTGADARAVKLVADDGLAIRYDSSGNENQSLSFSTEIQGFSGAVTYDFFTKAQGGIYEERQARSATSTFTLAEAQEPDAGQTLAIRVRAYEDTVEKASDTLSVYGLATGNTITTFLTNPSHTEPADSAGALTGELTDAGGVFRVFRGTQNITSSCTFSLDSATTGLSTIIGAGTGVYTITAFDDDGSSNIDKGSARYQVTIPGSELPGQSADLLIDQVYSIVKSKQGIGGSDGENGIGTDASPASSAGYVYYSVNTGSTPTTPSATNYDLTTDTFTGLTTNWGTNPPAQTGLDGTFWAARYFAAEDAVGGGVDTSVTFSAPFKNYNFVGLVTFTNLDSALSNGVGADITTIDGGLINTGTINANLVNLEYDASSGGGGLNIRSATSGSRMEMNGSSIDIYDSAGTLRVKIGAL